jgi:hypothetical protein
MFSLQIMRFVCASIPINIQHYGFLFWH